MGCAHRGAWPDQLVEHQAEHVLSQGRRAATLSLWASLQDELSYFTMSPVKQNATNMKQGANDEHEARPFMGYDTPSPNASSQK